MKEKEFKNKFISSIINGVVLFALLVTVLIVAFNVYLTPGWFAGSDGVSATGMQVVTSTDSYDLAIKNVDGGSYPALNNEITDGESSIFTSLMSFLSSLSFSQANKTGSSAGNIVARLNNENDIGGESSIRPGSYGTIEFYVIPKTSGLSIHLDISMRGIVDTVVSSTHTFSEAALIENPSTDEELAYNAKVTKAYSFINGHILLFQNRTSGANGYTYTNPIGEEGLDYTCLGVPEVIEIDGDDYNCYLVTIYWVWSRTFSQIALETGDANLRVVPIISNSSLRSALVQDMKDHPEKYFEGITTVDTATYMADTISYKDTYYTELNVGYNAADTIIGTTFNYLLVDIATSALSS